MLPQKTHAPCLLNAAAFGNLHLNLTAAEGVIGSGCEAAG
jgi:hypothetical protein